MQVTIPSLLDFSNWLNYELKIQETVYESLYSEDKGRSGPRAETRCNGKSGKSTSIHHTTDQPKNTPAAGKPSPRAKQPERTAYCPYCTNTQHFLDQCANFAQLTVEQKTAEDAGDVVAHTKLHSAA